MHKKWENKNEVRGRILLLDRSLCDLKQPVTLSLALLQIDNLIRTLVKTENDNMQVDSQSETNTHTHAQHMHMHTHVT